MLFFSMINDTKIVLFDVGNVLLSFSGGIDRISKLSKQPRESL